MSAGFTFTDYAFNANRSLPANAALGIFSAADFAPNGNPYGTGGNDTVAVQGALNAAAARNGIAFLTPPPSGKVNVSATLIALSGVWLVGASPEVQLNVIPSSNLDWLVATGQSAAVDYRTVFSVNYRNLTLGGNPYTAYDPARPTALAVGGGLMNLTLVGDASQLSGLGHGLMLNAATGFQLVNVFLEDFIGEAVSLWDCSYLTAENVSGRNNGRLWATHRASYDVSLIASSARECPVPSYIVYTEQFQIPNGPLLTLTPFYTKLVDIHHYSTVLSAAGVDLGGPAFVNMTGCTADNISGSQFYEQETRFGSVPYQILTDVAPAGGVTAVSVTAPITDTGTATHPDISLDTPLPVLDGGTGTGTPDLVEGSGITITGTWPNQTITNSAPGSDTLAGLTDVLIATPADGEVLTYVAASSKWENLPPASVGPTPLAFNTSPAGTNFNPHSQANSNYYTATTTFSLPSLPSLLRLKWLMRFSAASVGVVGYVGLAFGPVGGAGSVLAPCMQMSGNMCMFDTPLGAGGTLMSGYTSGQAAGVGAIYELEVVVWAVSSASLQVIKATITGPDNHFTDIGGNTPILTDVDLSGAIQVYAVAGAATDILQAQYDINTL